MGAAVTKLWGRLVGHRRALADLQDVRLAVVGNH